MRFDFKNGNKYLVTCDNWFYAPDGNCYNAVYGKINGVYKDEELLGMPNRKGANWFIEIGNMIVSGCQIHYAIQTDTCSAEQNTREDYHEGKLVTSKGRSTIYFAD